jgi:ubiquinone/menaquinone biosynthesis C-methylase UbiE
VPRAFDDHADSYDRMVGANPGLPRHLRPLRPSAWGCPDGGRGLRLLDLGCGTGASTAALLEVAPEAEIIAVDASTRC